MCFTLKEFQSPPLCSLSVYAHAHTMLRYIGYRPLTETGREKTSVSVQRDAWHRTKFDSLKKKRSWGLSRDKCINRGFS